MPTLARRLLNAKFSAEFELLQTLAASLQLHPRSNTLPTCGGMPSIDNCLIRTIFFNEYCDFFVRFSTFSDATSSNVKLNQLACFLTNRIFSSIELLTQKLRRYNTCQRSLSASCGQYCILKILQLLCKQL